MFVSFCFKLLVGGVIWRYERCGLSLLISERPLRAKAVLTDDAVSLQR